MIGARARSVTFKVMPRETNARIDYSPRARRAALLLFGREILQQLLHSLVEILLFLFLVIAGIEGLRCTP